MRRKITYAMARREGDLLLRGIVELDEGFLGGKRSRLTNSGRRQPGKTMVAVAAERTPDGGWGRAHLCIVADASAGSLTAAAQATIAAGSVVQTDGWNGYAGLKACRLQPSSAHPAHGRRHRFLAALVAHRAL